MQQGRRIPKHLACEQPNVVEIKDVLEKSLKLPCAVEDKRLPRDFWQRGRVRVTLRKEDGTLKEFPTKKALMIEIARLVPKHPGRVPGSAEWKKRLVTPKEVLTQFTSQPGQAGAVAAAAGERHGRQEEGQKGTQVTMRGFGCEKFSVAKQKPKTLPEKRPPTFPADHNAERGR